MSSHATLQLHYSTLSPHQRLNQDAWAQTQLSKICPGKLWARIENGYICGNGLHFVSDALLSECTGWFYRKESVGRWEEWPSYGRGCVKKEKAKSAGVVAVAK